ncbi:MAG TPA: SMI1/KNR4 family protein [Chthonomonadaceae bacterium]|nr:SMI1/KNR4 family protein [Chthonomonadaceae bacterium]
MRMIEANPSVSKSQLESVENQFGFRFPKAYREFLQTYNGGRPEKGHFSFLRDGIEFGVLVDWFLGIHEKENDNLLKYYRIYKDRIPSDLLPIAHTPGGNLICLAWKGNTFGKIFYWDHDGEVEEGEIPDYRNVYMVAGDLESFLKMLSD